MRRLRRYLQSPYAVRQFLVELTTRDYQRLHPRVGRFVLRFGSWGYRIITLWSRPLWSVLFVLSKVQWRKLPFFMFTLWGWGLLGGGWSIRILWSILLAIIMQQNEIRVVERKGRWERSHYALFQLLRGPKLFASRLILQERRRQLWKNMHGEVYNLKSRV